MTKINAIPVFLFSFILWACSPEDMKPSTTPDVQSNSASLELMRSEFTESCLARPEYNSRRRSGTLAKHCKCVFQNTMKNLSDNDRVIAAFYLYGETHDAFNKRLKEAPPDFDGMGRAAKAVGDAVKRCP